MLENIKVLLGITDIKEDVLLNILITTVTQKVLNYTNQSTLLPSMECIVMELVVIRYRKIGLEHTTGQSLSGANITLMSDDIPQEYKTQLNHFRKVRMI